MSSDRVSADTLNVEVLGAGDRSGEELWALRSSLSRVDELRGQVRLRQPRTEPGKLGAHIPELDYQRTCR